VTDEGLRILLISQLTLTVSPKRSQRKPSLAHIFFIQVQHRDDLIEEGLSLPSGEGGTPKA
jgi:hypothetical protein